MPVDVCDVPGVDALYDRDPSDFTKARDELVKQLREAGEREAAAAVKKLRRPTVVAWAVNQVARRDRSDVEELIDLGSRMRQEQASLLEGGNPTELREVADRRRATIQRLASRAAELAGESHRSDAAATLDAASLDPDRQSLLRSGRLSETLDPPAGFGIAGMPEPSETANSQRIDRRARKRLEEQAERASSAVTAAERRLARAETQHDEAQAAVDRAQSDLDAARAGQREALERLEELDR